MNLESHRTACLVYIEQFHDNTVWTPVPRIVFSGGSPQ